MATVLPTARGALLELDERRRRLFANATGRVLDLNDYSSYSLPALADRGERYDTIVSILQISVAPDPAAYVRTIASLLSTDGRLLFLEPTALVGAAGAVQRAFGPWMRRTSGRRHDHDIPAIVRAAGLSIGDCERITLPALWPYRSYVEGRARRPFEKMDDVVAEVVE